MEEERTTAVVQRYLDALAGDAPAEAPKPAGQATGARR